MANWSTLWWRWLHFWRIKKQAFALQTLQLSIVSCLVIVALQSWYFSQASQVALVNTIFTQVKVLMYHFAECVVLVWYFSQASQVALVNSGKSLDVSFCGMCSFGLRCFNSFWKCFSCMESLRPRFIMVTSCGFSKSSQGQNSSDNFETNLSTFHSSNIHFPTSWLYFKFKSPEKQFSSDNVNTFRGCLVQSETWLVETHYRWIHFK